ncbi:hypothetical protein ACHAW6_000578, partial [Cyclotella cf. meneghiniana]
MNCQACVKADLQFMYFGVISLGSINDNISYPNAIPLKNAFDSLPLVEMAFGRLVNKFHIVSGTTVGLQDRASSVLIACVQLHTYIIHEDKPRGDKFEGFSNDIAYLDDVSTSPIAPLGMTYLPVVPNDKFQKYDGIFCTREAIVEFIREQDIRRPIHNLEREKRKWPRILRTLLMAVNGQE